MWAVVKKRRLASSHLHSFHLSFFLELIRLPYTAYTTYTASAVLWGSNQGAPGHFGWGALIGSACCQATSFHRLCILPALNNLLLTGWIVWIMKKKRRTTRRKKKKSPVTLAAVPTFPLLPLIQNETSTRPDFVIHFLHSQCLLFVFNLCPNGLSS